MQPLSAKEAQTVNQAAQKIIQHGFQQPAIFLLEAGRPVSFLGGQLLWILQPALSLFTSSEQIGEWAGLLEKPAMVKALWQQLVAVKK